MTKDNFLRHIKDFDFHNRRSPKMSDKEGMAYALIREENILPGIDYPDIGGLRSEIEINLWGGRNNE